MAIIFGSDKSGNANNWTSSSLSTSSGITYDSMVDVPGIASVTSQPDIGGVQRGNYCTLNPLANGTNLVVDSGLLSVSNSTTESNHRTARANMGITTGKWYWEVHVNNSANVDIVGIVTDISSPNTYVGATANSFGWGYSTSNGSYYGAGEWTSSGTAPAHPSSGIIGIALDLDEGKIWFSSNGTWLTTATGVGNPSLGIYPTATYGGSKTTTFFPAVSIYYNTGTWNFNFGQRPFAYTPPTGFKTLNTTNLPNPVIKRPSEQFDIKLYTGNGNSIAGTSLQIGTTAKQSSAYAINKSLRLRAINSTTLSRTPTSASNRKTWTWSAWVKRGVVGTGTQDIFNGNASTGGTLMFTGVRFIDDVLYVQDALVGTYNIWWSTNTVYQNPSAWYHIVVKYDTTQASSSNAVALWVNGVQQTLSFTANTGAYVQNRDSYINSANIHYLGAQGQSSGSGTQNHFDGHLAEVQFIDGQTLTPSSFGVFDANNNWMPQRYTGTYGTNGFYVPLSKPTDTPVMSYGVQMTAGSGQYLQTPSNAAFQFGTGDFTIEMFVYHTNSGSQTTYFGDGSPGPNAGIYFYRTGSNTLSVYTSSQLIDSTATVPVNQWVHVAITRSGTSLRLFIDGKIVGSATNSTNFTDTGGVFIGNDTGGSGQFVGAISNVRVVKGTAVYTADFTPASSNLTAISGTSLLTCQAATIVDASTNAFSITNTGTVTVIDASPWQRTVGYDASGSNNNLYPVNFEYSVPRSTVLTYGTPGTYTWVAPAGVTSVKALVIAGGGAGATNGGGGGAGGMIYNAAVSVTPGTSYTVTVGRGGASRNEGNATNSVFSSLTAVAGGNGASHGYSLAAQAGGSGGGGSLYYNAGGAGTAGQGNAGGAGNNGNAGNTYYGGGGGGAGGTGFAGGDSRGGPGLVNSITGVPIYYAGGGGGNFFITNTAYRALGGIGGGGTGAGGISGPAAGGRPNSGGGGGATTAGLGGGPGGSGVVILSYTNAALYDGVGANSIIASDISRDTPTDFEDTTGVSGNYPILNYPNYPISNSSSGNTYNITNAGLTLTSDSSGAHKIVPATMPISSGKWYFEMILENTASDAYVGMGLIPWPLPNHDYLTNLPSSTSTTNGFSWQSGSANNLVFWTDYINGASRYVTMNPITASAIGDVMQIAIDIDNNKIWAGRNNTWYDASGGSTGNPSTGANPTATNVSRYIGQYGALVPFCSVGQENMVTANFGQTGFMYTPPTGFKAINSKNLKDVGSTNLPDTFGNFVNTPDLVWIKSRSNAYLPSLFDTVRGPNRTLNTHATTAQDNTSTDALVAFNPNGFSLGANQTGSVAGTNVAGATYVAWNWNRGRTPGFDIVNYAGAGTGTTFEHNLGVEPSFVIIKCTSTTGNWITYHKSLTNNRYLYLNSTGAEQTQSNAWTPTSNRFSINQTWSDASTSGLSYIAYLWAEVPGFSKFGSYTGNNSATDGPFIYTGFRPRFVMIKRTSSGTTGNWSITDTAINPSNTTTLPALRANTSDSESTVGTVYVQPVSNGFKITNNNTDTNGSSNYIYIAFAESPFKYANAR